MKEIYRQHPHYAQIEQELNDLLQKDETELGHLENEIIILDGALQYIRELYNGDECQCLPTNDEFCSFCKHLYDYITYCNANDIESVHVPVGMIEPSIPVHEFEPIF